MADNLKEKLDKVRLDSVNEFKEKVSKSEQDFKKAMAYKEQLDAQDNGYASFESGSLMFLNQESEVFGNAIMTEDRLLTYNDIVNSVYDDMNLLQDVNDNNSNYFTGNKYLDADLKNNLAFDFGFDSPDVTTDDIKNSGISDTKHPSAIELGHYLGFIKDYSMIKATAAMMTENDVPPEEMFASKEGAIEFGDKLNASIKRMSKYMSAVDNRPHLDFQAIDMNDIYDENNYNTYDAAYRLRSMDVDLSKTIIKSRNNTKNIIPKSFKNDYYNKSTRLNELALDNSNVINDFDYDNPAPTNIHSL